jgi:hypothetical protein
MGVSQPLNPHLARPEALVPSPICNLGQSLLKGGQGYVGFIQSLFRFSADLS